MLNRLMRMVYQYRGYRKWMYKKWQEKECLTSLSRDCVTRSELSEKMIGCQRWNWRQPGKDLEYRVKKHSKKFMLLSIRKKS